jgi:hypothetical protein
MALSGTDCMPNDRPSVRAGDAAGRARRFGRTGPRLAGDPHAWAQAFVPAPGESRPGSSRLAGAARLRGAAVPASLPPSRPGPALGGRRRDGAGSGAAGRTHARRRRVPGVTMRGSVEKYVGGDRESGGMFRLTRSAGAGAKLEAAPTSRWPRRPAPRTEAGSAWPAIRGDLRRARVRRAELPTGWKFGDAEARGLAPRSCALGRDHAPIGRLAAGDGLDLDGWLQNGGSRRAVRSRPLRRAARL